MTTPTPDEVEDGPHAITATGEFIDIEEPGEAPE